MLKLSEGLGEVQQRVEDVEARLAIESVGGSDPAFGSRNAQLAIEALEENMGGFFSGTCCSVNFFGGGHHNA